MNPFLSLQAAHTAPMLMMSQNRLAARDRLEAHNDYEINRKAEEELGAAWTESRASARLFWVRCHDLEVLALSEREEGVPRATAGMDAPNCGSDASVLLDKCGTAIEVVTAEDDVVQHGDAFAVARVGTGQKSRPDVLHRNQAA
jgi:hypothetical protein